MLHRITYFLIIALVAALPARAFETQASAAYVVDLNTGTTLLSKNADTPLPPASMSKLMTLLMLFEALRDNPTITLDTTFTVSSKARAMGGSTMFLNERDKPTVEELIKGIIVQSGNDATVVVAEGLAGTEDAFARMMNKRATELGMTQSTFANASGWPSPNHLMSMRDLVLLAETLIEEFPEYYGWFALSEWDFDGRAPKNRFNRNPLLTLDIGADGLKTGHTQEAGYSLVGSAKQGSRRIVFAFTGLDTREARRDEAQRMFNWGFRQFVEVDVASEGNELATAPVWMGEVSQIGLVAPEDLTVLVPAVGSNALSAEVVFNGPLEAPIAVGDQVAELVVVRDGLEDARLPLVADRDVPRGGLVPRLRAATTVLGKELLVQVQGLF